MEVVVVQQNEIQQGGEDADDEASRSVTSARSQAPFSFFYVWFIKGIKDQIVRGDF